MTRAHTTKNVDEWLWPRVVLTTLCWLWQGRLDDGYGHVAYERRMQRVHRVVYQLCVGPIPPGMLVCHRCDVRNCVRPDHLFLGTLDDNMADKTAKGRAARQQGEAHGNAKLTADQVRHIRALAAEGPVNFRALGREYGVSKTLIASIVHRVGWRHLP